MIEAWHRRSTAIIASTGFNGKGIAGRMDKLWPVKKDAAAISDGARKQLERFRELQKQRDGSGN